MQLNEYSDQLDADTYEPGVKKVTTTGIVRDPGTSLASATGTCERISDGAEQAQVGVVWTTWAEIRISQRKRPNCERCKETRR